jgi:hypothetical protein
VRRKRKPVGGGGARHPNSLGNLRRGGPPAPIGNHFHQGTHGGYRVVVQAALDAKARQVFEAISADAPLRGEDGGLPSHDAVVVRLLADCLCRLDSVGAWLAGRWATTEARPALELEMRLRTQALDLAESMGMTPRSRSRLGLDLKRVESFDLARQWAEEGEVGDG